MMRQSQLYFNLISLKKINSDKYSIILYSIISLQPDGMDYDFVWMFSS